MTPAQIRKAARLYLLANTACLDLGGCETEVEGMVVAQAIRDARQALEKMGLAEYQVGSLQACMRLATREKAGGPFEHARLQRSGDDQTCG